MGHSLGAHIMSYVGKQIKGIGRLTGDIPFFSSSLKYNLSFAIIVNYLILQL